MDASNQIYVRSKAGKFVQYAVQVNQNQERAFVPPRKRSHSSEGTRFNAGNEEFRANYNDKRELLSLRECCLRLVALNMTYVESWVGFPDTMTQEILSQALATDAFRTVPKNDLAPFMETLQEGHPDSVMPTCQIWDDLLFINEYELLLGSMLRHTTELDLSNCHLGNDHDFLVRNVSEIRPLKKLNLSNNDLTDAGVRNIVERALLIQSWTQLTYLDLSRNDLSSSALARCHRIASLQNVLVSAPNSRKTDFDKGLQKLWDRYSFGQYKFPETSGWAIGIFKMLKMDMAEAKSLKKKRRPNSAFYTRAPARNVSMADQNSGNFTQKNYGNLICYRRLLDHPTEPDKKRRRAQGTPIIQAASTVEVDDILSMYK